MLDVIVSDIINHCACVNSEDAIGTREHVEMHHRRTRECTGLVSRVARLCIRARARARARIRVSIRAPVRASIRARFRVRPFVGMTGVVKA